MRFFLSILVLTFISCNQVPLEYSLQYKHTSEERDSMETRIASQINFIYEGSLIRQLKLDTLIALNDGKEEYFRKKSNSFSKRGEFTEGFPLMEKAVQLDPLNALYFTSWQMLFLYRDYERALADLEYYDDISQGVDYVSGDNINYLKGLAHKQLGNYDQAVEEFDKCIKHEGEAVSEYVYVYRGISNLRHECLDDAIIDFEKAIKKYANCTMAYVYLGEALINKANFPAARESLTKAEDLLCRKAKRTNPHFEVFDEVQLVQVYDLLDKIRDFI